MVVLQETNKDFGYLRILDLYSEKELKDIWKEISHLDYVMDTLPHLWKDSTGRAQTENGNSKMSGNGLYLAPIYSDRLSSAILTYNRKLFAEDITQEMGETHPSNRIPYLCINKDVTILNRYLDSQEYLPHYDVAAFTAITVLLNNQEKIKGGELYFKDYDISFGCVNNSCVIFPSWVEHSVSNLKCSEDFSRYSIAQLMYINYGS